LPIILTQPAQWAKWQLAIFMTTIGRLRKLLVVYVMKSRSLAICKSDNTGLAEILVTVSLLSTDDEGSFSIKGILLPRDLCLCALHHHTTISKTLPHFSSKTYGP
jgi:hypothetical protein